MAGCRDVSSFVRRIPAEHGQISCGGEVGRRSGWLPSFSPWNPATVAEGERALKITPVAYSSYLGSVRLSRVSRINHISSIRRYRVVSYILRISYLSACSSSLGLSVTSTCIVILGNRIPFISQFSQRLTFTVFNYALRSFSLSFLSRSEASRSLSRSVRPYSAIIDQVLITLRDLPDTASLTIFHVAIISS